MLVKVKATGQVLDLVGERLIPMLNSGAAEPFTPQRETAMLNRVTQTAVQFIKGVFRKPDALAIRQ